MASEDAKPPERRKVTQFMANLNIGMTFEESHKKLRIL